MLHLEYILLPTMDLSQRFLYRLSGEVDLNWNEGRISHLLLNLDSEKSMKSFARGEASLVQYNLKNQPGGELNLYKDTDVVLREYKVDSGIEPSQTFDVLKTDTLVVEYVHLPNKDSKYHYLVRFNSPMATVWMYKTTRSEMRDCEVKDDHIREFNKHISLDETVQSKAKGEWYQLLTEFQKKEDYPKELKWMFEIDKVKTVECKLIDGPQNKGLILKEKK